MRHTQRRLEPTPEQLATVTTVWPEYLRQISALWDQRRATVARLNAASMGLPGPNGEPESVRGEGEAGGGHDIVSNDIW